jgi:hypothetical protein
LIVKELVFLGNYTQAWIRAFTTRFVLKIALLSVAPALECRGLRKGKSDQAARPISIGPLNRLLGLHAQPINPVVFRGP